MNIKEWIEFLRRQKESSGSKGIDHGEYDTQHFPAIPAIGYYNCLEFKNISSLSSVSNPEKRTATIGANNGSLAGITGITLSQILKAPHVPVDPSSFRGPVMILIFRSGNAQPGKN